MQPAEKENIIVVKVGSSVLTKEADLDREAMLRIVLDIAKIVREQTAKIVLVSSGSKLIGKHRLQDAKGFKTGSASLNQVYSSVGQADLIHAYQDFFNALGVDIAQGLMTRRDFGSLDRYTSMRDVLTALLNTKIVPILNDNDLLTDEEVSFSDNDQLAAYVCAMLNAQRLVVLSDVDGLLDSPERVGGKTVPKVTNTQDARKKLWGRRKRDQSAGGMHSKIDTAELMMEFGIPMQLVNGKSPGVVQSVVEEGSQEGTIFVREDEEKKATVTRTQRWLRAGAIPQGQIRVSTMIAELLRHGRRASVLSIGVEEVTKPFGDKEVVEILDEEGIHLGLGVARMPSDEIHVNRQEEIDGTTKSQVVIHSDKIAPSQLPST